MGFFNIKKKVKNKDKQQILNENYQETYQEPTAKAKTEANKRQREHFNLSLIHISEPTRPY